MRWIAIAMLVALSGCASDRENAVEACGADAQCQAIHMMNAENRRAAALMMMGGGLQNYGATRAAAPVYQPAVTCYRVGTMMQCQ